MNLSFQKLELVFKQAAGTSRGIMKVKNSWILNIEQNGIKGKGEISIIEGLSPDFIDIPSFEAKIQEICHLFRTSNIEHGAWNIEHGAWNIEHGAWKKDLLEFPSILFGFETALLDLQNGGNGIIFKNDFSRGKRKIPINGLIWMGDEESMRQQIEEKIDSGFTTIKMKIGAIDFDRELQLLKSIRNRFSSKEITLRVDANGSFSVPQINKVLEQLAELEIHSIEQPIKPGQWNEMKELCRTTLVPIALDEELIGIKSKAEKVNLLDTIQPQYIILKPSLHGGISGCSEWIKLAEERQIGWWLTSALESNIGLNAICQFAGEYDNDLPQGLGTGSLYTNNVESNLVVENGFIRMS